MGCDSLVALNGATADGVTLLAKNSDRPPDECQPLVQLGRQRHASGAMLCCQYIEIPQVEETAAFIGSQPFWLWGLEHGLNEHGVAIGNHTVFTKDPLPGKGLLGMDLVRLGLERGTSAQHATATIAALLETYGQGGSGFLDQEWPYHNSFLIADRQEAYLLETSDRRWAAKRISDLGSASNHVSIGDDWDTLSPDAIEHAVSAGWWQAKQEERFDFAAAYRDSVTFPPVISSGRIRRSGEILEQNRGRIRVATLRGALRDHYEGPVFHPGRPPDDERFFCLCRHDAINNSAAGMVARLPAEKDGLLSYWGCLGSPCIGVFLPYYIDGHIPPALARGGREATDDSPWWKHKKLLELVERDFARFTPVVSAQWKNLEQEIDTRAAEVEAEALAMKRAGLKNAASELLTRFMTENVTMMMDRLDKVLSGLRTDD
jgi:dipeptidase